MASADVRVKSLGVSFRNEQVLRDVSFEVEDGEFCVIIGPSGCGKSTLLQSIAGLTAPDTGEVYINGQNSSEISTRERDLGYVFQEFEDALFPHMSVGENIAFGIRQKDEETDETELEDQIDELLDMLAIGHTKDDHPSELSGGQQQRVELARQLIRETDTILLDDPLADLDYKLQKQMELEIRKIQNELGSTFVYVTHNQDQALKLADKIVVMNRGQIEQIGTPDEVYHEPETAFVARFVGDSNVSGGTIERISDEEITVETGIGTVSATNMNGASEGDDGVLMVRPGNVQIGDIDDDTDNVLEATPLGSTYMGETTEIVLEVDGFGEDFYSIRPGKVAIEDYGETVQIGFSADEVQFFDDLSRTNTVTTKDILEL
jgi:ABC-type Fe3+/spermidine/putrescine transport system ATPase subunit